MTHDHGTLTLENVTITGNTADSEDDGLGAGGGIAVGVDFFAAPAVTIRNTIIAGNAGSRGRAPDCFGSTLASNGHNLVGNMTGCSVAAATGDQLGSGASPLDPLLGPLQDNGGPRAGARFDVTVSLPGGVTAGPADVVRFDGASYGVFFNAPGRAAGTQQPAAVDAPRSLDRRGPVLLGYGHHPLRGGAMGGATEGTRVAQATQRGDLPWQQNWSS